MFVLSVILARAGSRGLPNKCLRPLCGRVVVDYSFDHALESRRTSAVIFTTDCAEAAERAQNRGIDWVRRPPHLATDTATVDDAARHAVEEYERRHRVRVDIVVLLYGNVPIRRHGVIDHAIRHLIETEADSVRTVTPVGKHHPDWTYRIDGDRMSQYRPNSLHRRQDLEPLYVLDGALTVVTRDALFAAVDSPADRQAFLGSDRRAITVAPHDTVDIDEPLDLCLAEAILSMRSRTQ
ncbi:MAG: acylneuraminate cytidylyltransferase family protein [Phycisphaerales bacterium]|nr:MAG: acylneuraminate cytidylyltransferase family protein [Phycisphaerales bacterium]